MTADEKILWLLEKDWLYVLLLKHEVFSLLADAYPDAIEETRKKLLEEVIKGPVAPEGEVVSDGDKAHEIYGLLDWLHNAAPDCSLTATAFKEIQIAYPSLGHSEFPDLNYRISSGYSGVLSPITVEELLEDEPADSIQLLLKFEGEKFDGPSREGLLATVTEAVSRDFRWALALISVLRVPQNWKTDLWKSIFRGFQRSSLSEEQWGKILDFLSGKNDLLRKHSNDISDLLQGGVRQKDGGIPFSSLSTAEKVGQELWKLLIEDESHAEEEPEIRDWLHEAINQPGGKIISFLLHSLSRRIPNEKDALLRYTVCFQSAAKGKAHSAIFGRTVLLCHLHFLSAVDNSWAKENLLPLLDWDVDAKRARQAWHGYLSGGRWNEKLLPDLLPLYRKSFSRLSGDLSEFRDRFCEHLANIAVYSSSDPMKEGWLAEFIITVELEDRIYWASHIKHQLRRCPDEVAQEVWNRWMEEYWGKRIKGLPLPLVPKEAKEMASWATDLETVFPQVVQKICAGPLPDLTHTSLFYELREKEYPEKHANAVVQLLIHLLSGASENFRLHCPKIEEIVTSLTEQDTDSDALLKICGELSRLGSPNAGKLRNSIKVRG